MVRRRSQLPVLPAANPPIVLQRDDIGANGRDRAMSSYATRVCWHFMRNSYGAAYLAAEAKNTACKRHLLTITASGEEGGVALRRCFYSDGSVC
jgi:hypothetical protein